jgi:hypothetical protein
MQKTHKTKRLSAPVKRKKIAGMQRGKFGTADRVVDNKKAAAKLAEDMAAVHTRRAADIRAGKFEPQTYGEGNLKRGPKPDTTRSDDDKCTKVVSTVITPNELRIIEKMRLLYPFPPTMSQFIRVLVRGSLGKRIPQLSDEAFDLLMKDDAVNQYRAAGIDEELEALKHLKRF